MPTTLSSLRTEMRDRLADTATLFSSAVLDQAVRDALRRWNGAAGYARIGAVTLASATRELDLSPLTQPPRVQRLWLPYTAADPEHPPAWRGFEQWSDTLLYVCDGVRPAAGDVARIFYTTPHTLDGLDGASATTLRDDEAGVIVDGALALAIQARRRAIAEQVTLSPQAVQHLEQLAAECQARFEAALAAQRAKPAGGFVEW